MRKPLLIALAVLFGLLVVGCIVLANWTLPAPTAKIEKPLADDRLPR